MPSRVPFVISVHSKVVATGWSRSGGREMGGGGLHASEKWQATPPGPMRPYAARNHAGFFFSFFLGGNGKLRAIEWTAAWTSRASRPRGSWTAWVARLAITRSLRHLSTSPMVKVVATAPRDPVTCPSFLPGGSVCDGRGGADASSTFTDRQRAWLT